MTRVDRVSRGRLPSPTWARSAVQASTPGPSNVVAGWLSLPVPPMPKQRSRSRANYRKTSRRRPVPRVIARLERAGCELRRRGDGWIVLCPRGRYAIEIRPGPDGTLRVACAEQARGVAA